MKATLVYFDTYSESYKGTLRGLVGIIPILLFAYIMLSSISVLDFITALLITSGMGVIIPPNVFSAAFFGFTIGLLVSLGRLSTITSPHVLPLSKHQYSLYLPFITSISNIIVYYIFHSKERS